MIFFVIEEIAGVDFGPAKKEKAPKQEQKKNEEKERLKAEKKAAKKAKAAEYKQKEGKSAKTESAEKQQESKKADEGAEDTEESKKNYGDLGIINSATWIERDFANVGALNKELVGKEVWVRGRLHNSRAQGGSMVFVVVRESQFTVQVIAHWGHVKSNFMTLGACDGQYQRRGLETDAEVHFLPPKGDDRRHPGVCCPIANRNPRLFTKACRTACAKNLRGV